MARPGLDRPADRGGDRIPATWTRRPALTAALAAAGAVGLALALAAHAGDARPALIGVPGALAVAVGALRRAPIAIALGLFALGLAYVWTLRILGGGADPLAPLVALAVLLVAELAFDAADGTAPADRPPDDGLRRAAVLIGLAVGAAGLAALAQEAATLRFAGGPALVAVGAAAAVLALALVTLVARRPSGPGSRRSARPARRAPP